MEVHQAATQMGAIHPFGHGLVMRIRHQQRQSEAAQQALGGAFPIALIVAHLDQLTGERHVIHIQPQCRTHYSADLDLLVIDVAAPSLEAVNLQTLLLVLLLALTQSHAVFSEDVLQIGIAVASLLAPALILAALRGERSGICYQRLIQHSSQLTITAGFALTCIPQLLFFANLEGKAFQSVAAVVVDGLLQFINLLVLRLMHGIKFFYLTIHTRPLFRQRVQPFFYKPKLQASKVGPQTVPASTQTVDFS